MNLKHFKLIIAFLFLLLFIISLTQNAITAEFSESNQMSSLKCFFMGSTAILGGGLFEQLIWFANPLSLVSFIFLFHEKKIALLFSFLALVLACSFSFWNEMLKSESGALTKIIQLESGYYIWILSILILNIGNILYFKFSKNVV